MHLAHSEVLDMMNSNDYVNLDSEFTFKIYWTFFYFMTSTLTTVGYGDFCANAIQERYLMTVIQAIGLIYFAIMQQEILSTRFNIDISTILFERRKAVKEFVARIDRQIPKSKLPEQYYIGAVTFAH
jgi:DNA integrity scanning protein DisA with diadenylate cyclase activity